MLRYTLTHGTSSIVLKDQDSPSGVDGFTLSFTRDETYGSVIRSYTISEKFHSDGKDWLKTIVDEYGWTAQIGVVVDMWNAATTSYISIIENGIVNLRNYNESESYTECNLEDGSFQSKMINNQDVEINLKSTVDLYGNNVDLATVIESVFLRDVNDNETEIKGIRAKYAIEKCLRIITGEPIPLDPGANQYLDDDLRIITTGRLIRNYDDISLSVNFKDLFRTLSYQSCLGGGINDGKFYIDRLDNFYRKTICCEITNISDLEYTFDDELLWKQLKIGYQTYEKKETTYGQSEFNSTTTYTNNINYFTKTKNLVCPYRADGVSIETLRALGTTGTKSNLDDEIFIIDCLLDDDGNLINRKLDDFITVSGIYGSYAIYTNMLLSPARMVKNWAKFLTAPFHYDRTKSILFQKNETMTVLSTVYTGESDATTDCVDIQVSNLDDCLFTGRIIKFNCTFDAETLDLINKSPNSLIKFTDYLNNVTNFGWIKEVNLKPVDKTHNIELYEAKQVDINEDQDLLLLENGDYIMQENTTLIGLEYG